MQKGAAGRLLTPAQIKKIRWLITQPHWTQVRLATHFKVSQTAISFIINKQTYKDVA